VKAVPYAEVGTNYAVCPGCLAPHRVTAGGRLWTHGPRGERCAWSRARVHWPIGRVTRGRPIHVVHLPVGRCA
jgi:hypothetical protein